MNNYTLFYTVQSQVVLDAIKKNGHSTVKKIYIQEKYGDTAKVFLTAYDWFVKHFETRIPKPNTAEYPIWLFQDPTYLDVHPGQILLTLRVPNNAFLAFDNAGWEKVLSMNYVGTSTSEEIAYNTKLEKMGLDCGYRAFETPFYPHIKREIMQSWARIFNLTDQSVVRAATWEIKEAWLVENTFG